MVTIYSGLGRLLRCLHPKRRWQAAGVLILTLMGVVAELASLGAVLPLLGLMTNPALSVNYPLLLKIMRMFGLSGQESVIPFTTLMFIVVALSAAAIRMLITSRSFQLTFEIGVDFGAEIYRRILYQSYSFHVAHNSSEILAGLSKVHTIIFGVVNPAVQIIVAFAFSLALLCALLYIDAATATIAIVCFSLIYVAISLSTRRSLLAYGKIVADGEALRVQTVQEGLGAIRDIILDNSQSAFNERFQNIDRQQRFAQSKIAFISTAPRYAIEGAGMALIAVLTYWLSFRDDGLSGALPVLGALALAAQRVMPQLQTMFYSWATLSGNRAALADVLKLLELPMPADAQQAKPLLWTDSFTLRGVSFRYRTGVDDVVRDVNLAVKRGERVGFVGKTGSGKSTAIDLIMGLLVPTQGEIEIDGKRLDASNRRAWQAQIAHVPQFIYLSDSSILENIAFGFAPAEIDRDRVRQSARLAQLADFVEALPAGYETVVGEQGVRLSGGQRQRIGLARAFYKRADLLIFDEATSALDDTTEAAVMRVIDALGADTTVLMIAHRLSTLKSCNKIVRMQDGVIVGEGTYRDLFEASEFRRNLHDTLSTV